MSFPATVRGAAVRRIMGQLAVLAVTGVPVLAIDRAAHAERGVH